MVEATQPDMKRYQHAQLASIYAQSEENHRYIPTALEGLASNVREQSETESDLLTSLIKKGLGRYCSVKCVPNSCMSHKKFTPERLEMQRKHLKKLGMKQRGSGNPMWRGGVTPINKLIRDSTKYKEWRQSVFIRDSFTCQHCNSFSRRDLEAHHKVAFQILKEEAFRYMPLLDRFEAAITYSPLWDISNGITLCKKCHDKIPKKSRGKNEKNKV